MRISEYFAGKNVFITGGSGFLGKALIEKLLRSCPDLGNIYVLMRGRKGKCAQERLMNITDNPIFDVLKKSNPAALNKLVAIEGDVTKLKLGIDEENRKLLVEKVNYVYHMAASVRFDDHLKDAIISNVRSTRELIELIYEMKNMLSFVHVSTTYCNIDKSSVEEKIYPSHGDWKEAIRLAENMDDLTAMEIMTQKFIKPLPNTYTFTKRLAETLVVEMCTGKVPAVIARPSIVSSSLYDPIPGWIDNFNGPVGLGAASAKGILRVLYANSDSQQDYIFIDIVIRALIVISTEQIKTRDPNKIKVFNLSKYKDYFLTMKEMVRIGNNLGKDLPFNKVLWYPRTSVTENWYNYYIQVVLFHMIPAFFLDLGLLLAGKKSILFKLQRKIFIANCILYPFISRSFNFHNYNMHGSFGDILSEDREDFGNEKFCVWDEDKIYRHCYASKLGIASLLKENLNRDADRNLMRKQWLLDVSVKSLLGLLLLWYIFVKINIVQLIVNYVTV